MKAYFEQFGDVEKIRLARNKKVRPGLPSPFPPSSSSPFALFFLLSLSLCSEADSTAVHPHALCVDPLASLRLESRNTTPSSSSPPSPSPRSSRRRWTTTSSSATSFAAKSSPTTRSTPTSGSVPTESGGPSRPSGSSDTSWSRFVPLLFHHIQTQLSLSPLCNLFFSLSRFLRDRLTQCPLSYLLSFLFFSFLR
jgi:hypothetical protein